MYTSAVIAHFFYNEKKKKIIYLIPFIKHFSQTIQSFIRIAFTYLSLILCPASFPSPEINYSILEKPCQCVFWFYCVCIRWVFSKPWVIGFVFNHMRIIWLHWALWDLRLRWRRSDRALGCVYKMINRRFIQTQTDQKTVLKKYFK